MRPCLQTATWSRTDFDSVGACWTNIQINSKNRIRPLLVQLTGPTTRCSPRFPLSFQARACDLCSPSPARSDPRAHAASGAETQQHLPVACQSPDAETFLRGILGNAPPFPLPFPAASCCVLSPAAGWWGVAASLSRGKLLLSASGCSAPWLSLSLPAFCARAPFPPSLCLPPLPFGVATNRGEAAPPSAPYSAVRAS